MEDKKAPDKPGFEVGQKFYPFATSFRVCDPALVTETTGLQWTDFLLALGDEERAEDPVIQSGLLAVAVWQQNPLWKRDRVLRFVQQIEMSEVELVGGEEPEEAQEEDPDDPLAAAGSETSSDSPSPSNGTSTDSTLEPSNPTSSGRPGSVIGSPV